MSWFYNLWIYAAVTNFNGPSLQDATFRLAVIVFLLGKSSSGEETSSTTTVYILQKIAKFLNLSLKATFKLPPPPSSNLFLCLKTVHAQDVQPILLGGPGQCQVLRSDCWLQESWLGTKCCHPGICKQRVYLIEYEIEKNSIFIFVQAKREAEEQRLCAELEDLHNGSSSPMRDHWPRASSAAN